MNDRLFEKIKNVSNIKNLSGLVIALVCLNLFFIINIGKSREQNKDGAIYFLNVGQGDSELIWLPGGVKILIDGGPPNKKAAIALSQILSPFDKNIDLVIISHPELDHYGGLEEVARRYEISALISNGREADSAAYKSLKETLVQNQIPEINLFKNDKIKFGSSVLKILNPDKSKAKKEKSANETSLIIYLKNPKMTAIFTGDSGLKTEKTILSNLPKIDVLKVGHHGSKTSTGENFVKKLTPKIAVIEVGKNGYGHPRPEVVSRLEKYGAQIFRTDLDETIKITGNGKDLKVISVKQ